MNHRPDRNRWWQGFVLLFVMASMFPGPGFAAGDDLVIIANSGLYEDAIGQKDLQRIFLGKKTRWDDKSSIVPVMLKSGPLHDRFIEGYLERSVQRFVTYWRQMVFTGKGVPPRNFVSETALVDFVAATPGSVGFVSAATNVSGVKILALD
ncbi:MAG: hypothetical protein ABFS42_04745 [Candidatus Krumholzibacteriota bacterium]